jgi:hypothetical protein
MDASLRLLCQVGTGFKKGSNLQSNFDVSLFKCRSSQIYTWMLHARSCRFAGCPSVARISIFSFHYAALKGPRSLMQQRQPFYGHAPTRFLSSFNHSTFIVDASALKLERYQMKHQYSVQVPIVLPGLVFKKGSVTQSTTRGNIRRCIQNNQTTSDGKVSHSNADDSAFISASCRSLLFCWGW